MHYTPNYRPDRELFNKFNEVFDAQWSVVCKNRKDRGYDKPLRKNVFIQIDKQYESHFVRWVRDRPDGVVAYPCYNRTGQLFFRECEVYFEKDVQFLSIWSLYTFENLTPKIEFTQR